MTPREERLYRLYLRGFALRLGLIENGPATAQPVQSLEDILALCFGGFCAVAPASLMSPKEALGQVEELLASSASLVNDVGGDDPHPDDPIDRP